LIYVLAGVNGAGKSSIGGSNLRAAGWDWYNPDEIALEIGNRFPNRRTRDIYQQVLAEGDLRLKQAIRDNKNHAFETTLGGSATTNTLLDAIAGGIDVNVWYCGLASAELHIERVAARAARGGHDVAEHLIRSRYATSMQNLCRITPSLRQLAVYDNSAPLDHQGRPRLRLLLHLRDSKLQMLATDDMPDWAKPVATVVLQKYGKP